MNATNQKVYDLIIGATDEVATIKQVCLGLTWTLCRTAAGIGFAQSPGTPSRVLSFPGTLAGRRAFDVARWLTSWDPFEATVGLAAANASINTQDNVLMRQAQPIAISSAANLAVFEFFRPRLAGKKVVVIGRYPGLDDVVQDLDVTVLERQPGENDLPDPAAEFLLPEADWVFLTATSLINKTFPRLADLAAHAVTVLMGPSTPWLSQFADFGIDFLAGTVPVNTERAAVITAEGGGTRLFGEGVRYAVADIGYDAMKRLKREIAEAADACRSMKAAMEAWHESNQRKRFPHYAELETLTTRLSKLDTRYKRQWDARNTGRRDAST